MANAGCINAYDCAGCYLTTLQQLQSDNIGVAINYTAPWEYWRRQLDYIKYTDKCGCTCCLTGENELRIVATQWVIKNFTLTNDDTNEVVNVKWNDLFGSNRAYTMVRYKTGSYPTSITDGTLAVKETTQNQYATNGYNVSWLTDWTKYYFTAFAVSQDGTIIVMQNMNITTDFGRQPWINTILYYPFKQNANDFSWNNRNWTSYETTFSENSWAYFWTTLSRIQIPNFTIWTQYTISVWFKCPTLPTWSQEFNFLYAWSASYRNTIFWLMAWWIRAWIWNWWTSQSQRALSYNLSTGWNNLILVRNWANQKIYLNKQLIWENNASYNSSIPWNNVMAFPHALNSTAEYSAFWYQREYIIENLLRTQSQVDEYYDKTKKKFWDQREDFQEVEYIWTTANQYINTWIYPWNNIQVETKVEVQSTTQEKTVFWNYISSSTPSYLYYHLTAYQNAWYFWINNSELHAWSYSPVIWTQYTIVYNNSNSKLSINWTEVWSTNWTQWISWSTLYINARWTTNYCDWQYKFFYFKVFNKTTGEYERDLVPCYRKSDGVIWMYDKINYNFYTNNWTWTFTKWPDVN